MTTRSITQHQQQRSEPVETWEKSSIPRALIKLGIDIHTQWLVVVAQHDHASPRPPRRFLREEFIAWVEELVRQGHCVHAVYEACGFGFGLCRKLGSLGAHCVVVSPQKLDESNTRIKTDGRDARTLCLRLDRYLLGNPHALAVIRIPREEEEQLRNQSRQRDALVRHRSRLQAQGRSLLVSFDLPAPSNWWKPQTWGRLQKHLPAWIIPQLELTRPVLLTLEAQISTLTGELEVCAPEKIPSGVGKLTSVSIGREICDWTRFQNRRQVASYTGLCPGEYSSGNKRVQGSGTKHGNPRLRCALVELAWRMVRFQPDYPPVGKRLHILGKGARATSALRKKAIVAVARQLAVDFWRLQTGQTTPERLHLKLNPHDALI